MYRKYLKRPMDFILVLISIIILSPVMLITAFLVRIKLGKPIVFKQNRPGLHGKIFTMYKFRTMTDAKNKNGELLSDAERLTKFGKLLRSTSLDELPGLFNILKGDMSIIGPRPLLVQYLPLYSEVQKRRHEVRPGLSGLAQVNGRNAISWEEKFDYDVQYVDHITFLGDWKIILRTVINVFKRDGINSETAATMEVFTGSNTKDKTENCEMNILILSAGRRVELVECFQRAARKLSISGKIIAADMSNLAPAIYFADKYYLVPRISEPGYIDKIIEICNQEDIRLVVPTIDTELLLLSEQKQLIETQTKAKVLISESQVIRICRNKVNTQKFFEENGFLVPRQIKKEDIIKNNIDYPVFIKPLDGSSSVNAFQASNKKELEFFVEYIENPIIQEMIVGEEYTIDAFLDFDSNLITVVPRIRMATRSGEILKGKIVKDREIIESVSRLMKVLKPIGHITIQCMKTKKGIEYIEINPRFGGGAPMSIEAGADSCEYLYRLLQGEKLSYHENYRDNLVFLRFDQSIILDENLSLVTGAVE